MKLLNLFFIICLFNISCTVQKPKAESNAVSARVNHIALYVYDLQKSRNFYENIVGLKWIQEPFKDGLHEWFDIGGAQFHIIKGAKDVTEHSKMSHICFSVRSVDDFIVKLKKAGISYTNWKGDSQEPTVRVDGVKQIYFTDPDGYWIEINDDQLKAQ